MTDAFASVRGQDRAVSILRGAIADGRVASAYLFDGPSGVGKQRAAVALATAMIGATERIAHGTHPDVRIFAPRDEGNRNIKVDFLREEILPYAEFAPFEGTDAFLIFPEADVSFPEQHQESANALLKTLEEPKRGVHFVLLAERAERLLPTIRSRCQRVRFDRLGQAELNAILAEHGVEDADRGPAVALSDGRADRALRLAADGAARALFDLAVSVDDVVARPEPGRIVEVAESLASHDELPIALDTLAVFYRDLACAALGADDRQLAFRHVAPEIRRRAAEIGAAGAASRVKLVLQTLEELEINANRSIAMDALLYRMRRSR